MFFRGAWFLILASCLYGCSLNMSESPFPTDVVRVEMQTACTKEIPLTFSRYIQGASSEKEINELFDCIKNTIQTFQTYTKSTKDSAFSYLEIKNFIEKFILKKALKPDTVGMQTMAFKQAMLGGAADEITKDELQRFFNLLDQLKLPITELRTYMPMNTSTLSQLNADEFQKIIVQIKTVGDVLSNFTKQETSSFSFYQLTQVVSAYEKFLEKEPSFSKNLNQYLGHIKFFKSFFLSGSKTAISSNEWKHVFWFLSQLYTVYLKQSYFFKHFAHSWELGEGNAFLTSLVLDGLAILEKSIELYPQRLISQEKFEEFIDLYIDQNSLVSAKSIKGILGPLMGRVLSHELPVLVKGNKKLWPPYGLNYKGLSQLKEIILEWKESQKILEKIYQDLSSAPSEDKLTVHDLGIAIEKKIEPAVFSSANMDEKKYLEEFLKLIKNWIPFNNFEHPSELTLDDLSVYRQYSLKQLSQMNWLYRITKLVMGGYSEITPDGWLGTTEDNLKEFELDFKKIFVDLKFLHPLKEKLYILRFLEANLFTFASYGDQWISVAEATQLISFMTSAKMFGSRIHNEIYEICAAKGKILKDDDGHVVLDYFNNYGIEQKCYWETLFSSVRASVRDGNKTYFSNLPGLNTYIAKYVQGNNNKFDSIPFCVELQVVLKQFMELNRVSKDRFQWAWNIAGRLDIEKDIIDSSDSETMMGILQYVEALITRFDKDSNGFLDRTEAMAAYPYFQSVIKKLAAKSNVTDPKSLEALYTYLLYEGKFPEKGTTVHGYYIPSRSEADYWLWKKNFWSYFHASGYGSSGRKFDFETDRLKVLKIVLEVVRGMQKK
ncbi:MAG: hypothetical protein HY843_02765 [Bdellovibrio sp.]|nr:hypothetical protein [Bdellovibrio sp.]